VYQMMMRAAFACVLSVTPALVSATDSPDTSPATAIRIVLDTQGEKIRAVDSPNEWWHDAKERSWSVKRPFEPGRIDSTHTFTVTYKINGVVAATWQVDTRKGAAVAGP
jgi:hypothetical protein